MKARHRDLPQGNRDGEGTHPWSSRGHESRHWLWSGRQRSEGPPIQGFSYISTPNGGPATRGASSEYTQTGTEIPSHKLPLLFCSDTNVPTQTSTGSVQGIYIKAQCHKPSAPPSEARGTPGPLEAVPHTVVVVVGYQAEG